MKDKQNKWQWALEVIQEAIKNSTLEKESCARCAVGNLIAKANNIQQAGGIYAHYWWISGSTLTTPLDPHDWNSELHAYREYDAYQSTEEFTVNDIKVLPGFTFKEVDEIEGMFENSSRQQFLQWLDSRAKQSYPEL